MDTILYYRIQTYAYINSIQFFTIKYYIIELYNLYNISVLLVAYQLVLLIPFSQY